MSWTIFQPTSTPCCTKHWSTGALTALPLPTIQVIKSHHYIYTIFSTKASPGMSELESVHKVAGSPADAIQQWFNAGGMIQFYDYPLEVYLNVGSPFHLNYHKILTDVYLGNKRTGSERHPGYCDPAVSCKKDTEREMGPWSVRRPLYPSRY